MTARVTRTTTAPRGLPPRPRRPRQRRRHSRRRRKSSVVSAQDVREAAAGLAGVAVRTPLRYVEPLGAYLKIENLQLVGAFKLRSEEHTSELQSPCNLVCRLLLEKKKKRSRVRGEFRLHQSSLR